MTTSTKPRVDDQGSVSALAEHHRTLDDRLDKLRARAQAGDPTELRAEWCAFERELLRHMELEEAEIFPEFARHDPTEAHALLSEHGAIRSALLDIGVDLDLHCLRAEAVDEFVRRLKAHARREDGALYAWAEAHVPPTGWRAIKQSLKDAVARGQRRVALGGRLI